ncbi:riboflavin synthase [Helicobacter muridarum]|uniref:Riboflavin synthase n=1 Tax=Helicobacter muridarum TaxID=216 RepID=A0A099TYP9_9HELI|nr:riboflavin synthase [Helicobacter muridarum]TLE01611.1 riboflavin synthase [Helicobacter muridarum]STQ86226.1 riboflavin synthase subunit alpha [Helicobacter muridarum]
MFSGLVRQFGQVIDYNNNMLCLKSTLYPKIGDSISVNGACLTVIKTQKDCFCVELSIETAKSIAIENLSGFVHIEPALKFNDGLHGHIVQGHVDSIGTIIKKDKVGNQTLFHIQVEPKSLKLMVNKGSVCIDGISLTVNAVFNNYFELVIIPHTMKTTLFHSYQVNRRVNIETDIIVRSLFALMQRYICSKDNINTQELLDSIALGY